MEHVSTKQEEINEKLAQYKKIKEEMDMLKIEQDEIKEEIRELLEAEDMNKFESEYGTINITQPYFQNRFNAKKLKEDNPFLYEQYMTKSEISGSVKISI